MRIATQVAWQIVDGEAIVVDLDSGKTLGLNPTATWLWAHLDGRDARQLADGLMSEFDVDRNEAEHDVDDFLRMLADRKLIANS
jgi:hypothetical protein